MILASTAIALTAASTPAIAGCLPIEIIPASAQIATRYSRDETDRTWSHLDPKKVEEQKEVRTPIVTPVRRINVLADRYRGSSDKNTLRCLSAHLHAQAQAGAMMSLSNDAGMFFREWMLASLAISYLKAKPAIDQDSQSGAIRSWLGRNAREVQAFNQRKLDRGLIDNHRYWGGLAVLATGLAIDDPSLIAFGRKVRQIGLSQVARDGTLQAELTRGSLSFHYHLFAAAPLAASTLLDTKVATPVEREALSRLAMRIADEVDAPKGQIATMTGHIQASEEHPVLFAFIEPFLEISDYHRKRKINYHLKNVNKNYLFLGGEINFIIKYNYHNR